MTESFHSSDANRSAKPLHHARSIHLEDPVRLQSGEYLPELTIAYEHYGQLNERRDNVVLICHALSGDSHVARHDADDDPGWWDIVVGPGKPIDTDRFCVLCANVLGGCRGTTGPNSINPKTGRPYGAQFPGITVEDMVDVQRRLLDHLGIESLLAVVGGSLGGHQALCWTTRYPQRVRSCIAIATSPHLTAQALAFDVIGRNAILRDPHFQDGQYYDLPAKPDVGLAIARMLGHLTYLSAEAMTAKFEANKHQPRDIATEFEKRFSVGSYLAYLGHRFVERFDANSYLSLSLAMDLFELGRNHQELAANLDRATCAWLVLSFTSDWLFPAFQSRQITEALIARDKSVTYCNVNSGAGHDAFLLDDSLPIYGELVRAFLMNQSGQAPVAAINPQDEHNGADPTSIFHRQRLDYDLICELIEPGASVLDLGCGSGGLLWRLGQRGHHRLVGVELDEEAIVSCVRRGLTVIQSDLNEGLPEFTDGQFDYVVLSQTLQSIVRTEAMVEEILRVGRRCIVSFPNFAYHKIRKMLSQEGRSPGTEGGLLHYAWFNTPNRRFLSVLDWQEFCAARGVRIHRQVFLDTESGRPITRDPNLEADLAIFVISR